MHLRSFARSHDEHAKRHDSHAMVPSSPSLSQRSRSRPTQRQSLFSFPRLCQKGSSSQLAPQTPHVALQASNASTPATSFSAQRAWGFSATQRQLLPGSSGTGPQRGTSRQIGSSSHCSYSSRHHSSMRRSHVLHARRQASYAKKAPLPSILPKAPQRSLAFFPIHVQSRPPRPTSPTKSTGFPRLSTLGTSTVRKSGLSSHVRPQTRHVILQRS
mmetsp:Transcript_20194/g.60225  ORF Transcript_20194/g.60225 Transcript_20194/m.60225 type:complete len:215 (+) Transcript_20194:134-778(+)